MAVILLVDMARWPLEVRKEGGRLSGDVGVAIGNRVTETWPYIVLVCVAIGALVRFGAGKTLCSAGVSQLGEPLFLPGIRWLDHVHHANT